MCIYLYCPDYVSSDCFPFWFCTFWVFCTQLDNLSVLYWVTQFVSVYLSVFCLFILLFLLPLLVNKDEYIHLFSVLLQTSRVPRQAATVVYVCSRAEVTAAIRSHISGAKCPIHVLEWTRKPSSSRRRASTITHRLNASRSRRPFVSRRDSRKTENRFVTSILGHG